ncbi:MAG: 1-acyl-sn-glycerol-3-phosphate acyltransferase [Bacteroidota bacterium]
MHRRPKFDPILPQAKNWPIVKLNKARKAFLQAVCDKAVQDILALQADQAALRQELSQFLAGEQERLQKKPWKVDAPDEPVFWTQVIVDLNQGEVDLSAILQKIVMRYASEIVGGFSTWHYQLAQGTASYILNRLLNPMKPRRPRTLSQIRAKLQEQIHILGAVKELRQLARRGTIVMVPTHCSHFDSVLIWWVIHTLGLPPFIYGAGLNLFNRQFFAYFMNKLGTYKIDRRKRNIAYLSTLKAYSTLALQRGCHSLFYPGGTRSRSGALETELKLGLLGTAVEAQQLNYQIHGPTAPKLFIVPVVFNYHFVLEAPLLIRDYLAVQGEGECSEEESVYTKSYKLLKFIKTFATKGSSITVSIGRPLDSLGNEVDEAGYSYNPHGARVDAYTYLCGRYWQEASQKAKECSRKLGQAIVQSYHKNNCVLSSHLVAFTAFALMRQQHAALDLRAFFQLPTEDLVLPYATLAHAFARTRAAIIDLQAGGQIQIANHLKQGSIAGMITHGLTNLGIYHDRRPLLRNRAGDITTRELRTLFYYHNRLTGYDLEKYIE